MAFKMCCPKCGSKNLTMEKDGGSYLRGGAVMLKCYTCGKMLYGEPAIQEEYKKQLAAWERGGGKEQDERRAQEEILRQREEARLHALAQTQRKEMARKAAQEAQAAADAQIALAKQAILDRQAKFEEHARLAREAAQQQREEREAQAAQRAQAASEAQAILDALEAQKAQKALETQRALEAQKALDEQIQREREDIQAAEEAAVALEAPLQDLENQIRDLSSRRDALLAEREERRFQAKRAHIPMLRREAQKQLDELRAGVDHRRIMVVCEYCGEVVEKYPGDAKKSKTGMFYCGPEHLGLWRKENIGKPTGPVMALQPEPVVVAEPMVVAEPEPLLVVEPVTVEPVTVEPEPVEPEPLLVAKVGNRIQVSCALCGEPVLKTPGDIKRSKTGKFFCCHDHHQEWLKNNPDVFRQMALKLAAMKQAAQD